MADYKKPLPTPTPDTKQYWDGLKQHSVTIQHCRNCNRYQHFPRSLCVECGSTDIEWSKVSGKGKIYSYTFNHRPPAGFEEADTPVSIALVQLDEGPKILTNIVGVPAGDPSIKIDARVEPVFEDVTPQVTLLKYKLA